jgi:glycosyltransferase involved in cell wall biosynthesis
VSLDIITTSVGGWDKYIVPLIDSIETWEEKTSNIIVIDAGNNYPDTYKDVQIIHTPLLNCSAAQNVGIRHSNADWFLIVDCDVLSNGKFSGLIESQSPDKIYGMQFHQKKHKFFTAPYRWLDGWIYAIPRKIFSKVGYFDEGFKGSGFEDADYCWRARHYGFDVAFLDMPFIHLADGQKRNISDNYKKVRLENIEYLKKKWNLKK